MTPHTIDVIYIFCCDVTVNAAQSPSWNRQADRLPHIQPRVWTGCDPTWCKGFPFPQVMRRFPIGLFRAALAKFLAQLQTAWIRADRPGRLGSGPNVGSCLHPTPQVSLPTRPPIPTLPPSTRWAWQTLSLCCWAEVPVHRDHVAYQWFYQLYRVHTEFFHATTVITRNINDTSGIHIQRWPPQKHLTA